MTDLEFHSTFGMTKAEAVIRAVDNDLKYLIHFDAGYMERLVCSINPFYDDHLMKWEMKKQCMMESIQQRKDELSEHNFTFDTEDIQFQFSNEHIFTELSVYLIDE
jgi:hypothetical protein